MRHQHPNLSNTGSTLKGDVVEDDVILPAILLYNCSQKQNNGEVGCVFSPIRYGCHGP